eukprot:TRINITY_DN74894_c0_g1_i1.p1 TRINITY_DN74894_c0_g1~~TRINITY_DN74894_c0_g1_i1.p1  ORF type:complete len:596 (+),score=35.21 TRINITY_DN74894_c0_g1_i1:74-1861(+)
MRGPEWSCIIFVLIHVGRGYRKRSHLESMHDASFLDVVKREGLNATFNLWETANDLARFGSYVQRNPALSPLFHHPLIEASKRVGDVITFLQERQYADVGLLSEFIDKSLQHWARDVQYLAKKTIGAVQSAQRMTSNIMNRIGAFLHEAYTHLKDVLLGLWSTVIGLISMSKKAYANISDRSVADKAAVCEDVWNLFPPLSYLAEALRLLHGLFKEIHGTPKGFAVSLEISLENEDSAVTQAVSLINFGIGINIDIYGNVNRFCFNGASIGIAFSLPPKLGADAGVGVSVGIWPNGMKSIFTGDSVSYCLEMQYNGVPIPGCIVHGTTPEFPMFRCGEEDCPAVRDVYGVIIPFAYMHTIAGKELLQGVTKAFMRWTSIQVSVLKNTAPPELCVWACGNIENCGQSYYGTCDEVLNLNYIPKTIQGTFHQYQGSSTFDRKAVRGNDNPEDVPVHQACGRKPRSCMAPTADRTRLCQFWVPCLAREQYAGGNGLQKYETYDCINNIATGKAYPCRYCSPSGESNYGSQENAPQLTNTPACVDDPDGNHKLFFFVPALEEEEDRFVKLDLAPEKERAYLENPSDWEAYVKQVKAAKR